MLVIIIHVSIYFLVKLQFTKCIPFDHDNMIGPKAYDIVAVSNVTGEQTGEFIATSYNSESELCPNNVR